MAHSNISKPDVESLVESICTENGLNDQTTYNFEDFCQLLSPQMDKIWNAGLEWKGSQISFMIMAGDQILLSIHSHQSNF